MGARVGFEAGEPDLHDDSAEGLKAFVGESLYDFLAERLETLAEQHRIAGVPIERFLLADGFGLDVLLER